MLITIISQRCALCNLKTSSIFNGQVEISSSKLWVKLIYFLLLQERNLRFVVNVLCDNVSKFHSDKYHEMRAWYAQLLHISHCNIRPKQYRLATHAHRKIRRAQQKKQNHGINLLPSAACVALVKYFLSLLFRNKWIDVIHWPIALWTR